MNHPSSHELRDSIAEKTAALAALQSRTDADGFVRNQPGEQPKSTTRSDTPTEPEPPPLPGVPAPNPAQGMTANGVVPTAEQAWNNKTRRLHELQAAQPTPYTI